MTNNMEQTSKQFQAYFRAVNYIAAIQIYLRDNYLLERPLAPSDIKPRLLGHWGTCPGINFVHGALHYLIRRHAQQCLYIVGPGHGFPAVQANLFMEGALAQHDQKATKDLAGLGYITKGFSWPFGFPSHSNPTTPGVILEGGELGYALSTAYGTVLDRPELLSVCLIGDGEAETGPTAAAWHLNKLVNHVSNGVVLPVLHLNGYKISGPTLYGRMTDNELARFFEGCGYRPFIVSYEEGRDIFREMLETMDDCMQVIRDERENSEGRMLRYPVIVLRTPKGWTGIKSLKGEQLEGSHGSHQVLAKNVKTDPAELRAVEHWFRSYRFEELFDRHEGFIPEIDEYMAPVSLRPGFCPYTNSGCTSLTLPAVEDVMETFSGPGKTEASSMNSAGIYLREVFRKNAHAANFRMFSPDETYSNKLQHVFEATGRAFQEPILPNDRDISPSGRVMEMLSEHSLQGMMQGYVLTGRHGVFSSYEAFIQIVSSMADQYIKFLKVARETSWRKEIPSFHYILTSSGWRQEHNGFSHQNPGFIDDMLNRQYSLVRVFFPPDATSTLLCLEQCLASCNGVNIITAGKTMEPQWQSVEQSARALREGLSVWEFASDADPQVVLAGIGDYVTKEALAAIGLLKTDLPGVRIRFVNVVELSIFLEDNPVEFNQQVFDRCFTPDKPLIFNFHGYPQTLKQLLFDYINDRNRISVHGYVEQGSTTTPFDMHVRNKTSRYHLAMDVLHRLGGEFDTGTLHLLHKKYSDLVEAHQRYIIEHGEDPAEIEQWKWERIQPQGSREHTRPV